MTKHHSQQTRHTSEYARPPLAGAPRATNSAARPPAQIEPVRTLASTTWRHNAQTRTPARAIDIMGAILGSVCQAPWFITAIVLPHMLEEVKHVVAA